MENKKAFYELHDGNLVIGNSMFKETITGVSEVSATTDDLNGLAVPYTKIEAKRENGTLTACVWDDIPMVWYPNGFDGIIHKFVERHWRVKCIKLIAYTDDQDTLTFETEHHILLRTLIDPKPGEIFHLENDLTGDAIVIISEAPDYVQSKISVRGGDITILNENNAIAVGFCKIGECEKLTRDYYRHGWIKKSLITMSNTWGDGNGDTRVCEDFVMKEIDAAEEIGVDVVQIDDGWSVGKGDTCPKDERGLRCFPGDYWELDQERFPNGMKYVADYAISKGRQIGLWFAPDSHNDCALLERDKEVLKKAYDEWNMRFFKLDMYFVRNKPEQEGILELMKHVYSLGKDVATQVDVTRFDRLNYLCGKQYGTVFVENRYTKLPQHGAYPHRVLRNMWRLGKYVPTAKFQFEMVNPDLNTDKYEAGDEFAPTTYGMDYIFATAMLSNPLFWMEMQFLSPERKAELGKIMPVWKEHREALGQGDVKPIGDEPCGRSITGFLVSNDNKPSYLLLFREVNDKNDAEIRVDIPKCKAKVLASNANFKVDVKDGVIKIKSDKARSYAFIKLS